MLVILYIIHLYRFIWNSFYSKFILFVVHFIRCSFYLVFVYGVHLVRNSFYLVFILFEVHFARCSFMVSDIFALIGIHFI